MEKASCDKKKMDRIIITVNMTTKGETSGHRVKKREASHLRVLERKPIRCPHTLLNGTSRGGENPGKDHHKNRKSYNKKSLTKEEEAKYWTQNKCFNYSELGHMSQNCPKGRTVASLVLGKLPGLKSYSVRVDLCETDWLREIALSETTTEMLVGMINIGTEYDDLLELMEVSEAEVAQPEESQEGFAEDEDPPSSMYNSSNEGAFMHSPQQTNTNQDLSFDMAKLMNLEPTDDYFEKVILTAEQDFGKDTYETIVPNMEEKLALVWSVGGVKNLWKTAPDRLCHSAKARIFP